VVGAHTVNITVHVTREETLTTSTPFGGVAVDFCDLETVFLLLFD
jgi:hypothetical protein